MILFKFQLNVSKPCFADHICFHTGNSIQFTMMVTKIFAKNWENKIVQLDATKKDNYKIAWQKLSKKTFHVLTLCHLVSVKFQDYYDI